MGKVIFRKCISILMVFAMTLTMTVVGMSVNTEKAYASSHTQAEAVAWANQRYYESWCVDYDGVYGCQCVDLIKYYCDYLGDAHSSFTTGNAYAYASNSLPAGWTRDSSPRAGDIFVCQPGVNGSGSYGHVGIVTEVRDSTIVYVNTNAGGKNGACTVAEGTKANRTYIHPNFYSAPTNNRPIGYLDSVKVGYNCITVTGWAFDPDYPSSQPDVHIYIGDESHAVSTKNVSRTDVDNVYHCGAWHGFETTIYTNKTGNQTVRAYGLDATDGNYNTELSGSGITVNIPADTTKPSISNVKITNIDATGYTVSCTVKDSQTGIDKVMFPTWTVNNGQDDLAANWTTNSSVKGVKNGNTWSFRVNAWEHNSEIGKYITHIYAYDKAGNATCLEVGEINVTSKTGFSSDFYATITNTKCGKAVAVASSGDNVQLTSASQTDNKLKIWHFVKQSNGTYAIFNVSKGEPIDVWGESTANCANFVVDTWHQGRNQMFYLVKNGSSVKILASHCGKAMDLTNFDTNDGANIALYSDNGTDAQQWTINKLNASLKTSTYTYSGKAKKPSVTVKYLTKGTDYTVSYSSNTKCGKAKVTVKGKGNYAGMKFTKYFKIIPAKAVLSKATAGSKKITVSIKSQKTSGVTGYQIYYKKAGSSAKTVTTTSTSKVLTGLTKGKKYTVKVRAYKTIDGKKYYGAYSTSKTVTVK